MMYSNNEEEKRRKAWSACIDFHEQRLKMSRAEAHRDLWEREGWELFEKFYSQDRDNNFLYEVISENLKSKILFSPKVPLPVSASEARKTEKQLDEINLSDAVKHYKTRVFLKAITPE